MASGKRSSAAELSAQYLKFMTVEGYTWSARSRGKDLRSSNPVPARRTGEKPIRRGMVWPVKEAMGDCS